MERALSKAGVSVTTATTDDTVQAGVCGASTGVLGQWGNAIYIRKWFDTYKFAPGVRALALAQRAALRCRSHPRRVLISQRGSGCYRTAETRSIRDTATRSTGPLRREAAPSLAQAVVFASHRRAEILQASSRVHCTSDAELDDAHALGLRFHGSVIPLGVEPLTTHHHMLREYKAMGSATKGLIVLYLSRIDPKKNTEGVLDAFAIIARERPAVWLKIAGDGPANYVAALKARSTSLGIARRVEWLGHVDGEAKAAALTGADVFVLASYSENFGIAAVEAMLAELPCVFRRWRRHWSRGTEGRSGPARAPEPIAIAVALSELLDDCEERKRMGERAKFFAQQEYSTNAMAERLITLYGSLMTAARNPTGMSFLNKARSLFVRRGRANTCSIVALTFDLITLARGRSANAGGCRRGASRWPSIGRQCRPIRRWPCSS